MVIVVIAVTVVKLVAVNIGSDPVPEATNPIVIAGLLFAQAKLVPATGPLIIVLSATAPLQ